MKRLLPPRWPWAHLALLLAIAGLLSLLGVLLSHARTRSVAPARVTAPVVTSSSELGHPALVAAWQVLGQWPDRDDVPLGGGPYNLFATAGRGGCLLRALTL